MRLPISLYIELSEETLLRLAHRLDAEKRVHETRQTLEVAQRQFRNTEKKHAAKKKAQRK